MSPAAATQQQVVTYTPIPSAEQTRDLIMVEQGKWGDYCGLLTRVNLERYLRTTFFGEPRPREEEEEGGFVDSCGYGDDLLIPVHVYMLAGEIPYQLRATTGSVGAGVLQDITERETVTFNMEREASIRHPAQAIVAARWLTGPWTIGGADAAPPPLSVSGQTVRSPITVFGSVELVLRVRRWRHIITIPQDIAHELLIAGWAEFVVGLPSGGRPVGQEITEPPGAEELAKTGAECGRGRGGRSSGRSDDPGEDEPTASGADKHINCDYCELECDDPDAEDEA